MYAYFRGKVAGNSGGAVILDVNGVGYLINATARFLSRAQSGQEVTLYTKLIVREDDMSLYGFESEDEKHMFERLTSVSGIGAKMAMAILSDMTAPDVATAVLTGNADAFTRVSGVGKKTAQRVILELKGKIELTETASAEAVLHDAAAEAVEALMGLGYTNKEAAKAVAAVRELADTVEDITLLALKRLR